MRAVASVILTVTGLVGLGFFLRSALPTSSAIPIEWNGQELYIPFNIAGFWICVLAAVVVGVIQAVLAILRDAERLR
jgi:hypothetical protein